MVSDADGAAVVAGARGAIAAALGVGSGSRSAPAIPLADELRGVFVTLRRAVDGELRGCIGYAVPPGPLGTTLPRAAVAAALRDPRFPPVTAADLPRLTVEVSLLTPPKPLPLEGRAEAIRIGRDGLIVETDGSSGLLLPQVATEFGWSAEEFLRGACSKAGLSPEAWRRSSTAVLAFQAEVFREEEPGGRAVRELAGGDGSGHARRERQPVDRPAPDVRSGR